MGMFDTVNFDREFSCPACGGRIDSVQVKCFDKTLEDYKVKDCVSHAEETRITKLELFCDSCLKHTGTHVYVERFMTEREMRKILSELWEQGHEVLSIYYPEQVEPGQDVWLVDVFQDEINEYAGLNWTWTVMSRRQLETDGENEKDLPEYVIQTSSFTLSK